jgi:hypothetical protein
MSYNSSSTTTENLPPKTIARLVREVRDLVQIKSGEGVEGVRLIVDLDSGLPTNLGELAVCNYFSLCAIICHSGDTNTSSSTTITIGC